MKYKEEFERFMKDQYPGLDRVTYSLFDKHEKYSFDNTRLMYDAFIAGIELKEQDGWISIKDRLPEIKDLPFVTIDEFDTYDIWEDSDWFDEIQENDKLSYQYWMPLLEPPTNK